MCLTVSEHRAAELGFGSAKPDERSPRGDDPTAGRRSSLVKQAAKCGVAESSCSPGTTLKDQLFLIGLPPPVVKVDPNGRVHTADRNLQARRSHLSTSPADVRGPPAARPVLTGPIPLVLRVSPERPSTSLGVNTGRLITPRNNAGVF